MSDTKISEISDEARKRIKKIVAFHYGFTPKDNDIEWIDGMLRNNYAVCHEQQILRELADNNIGNALLKHRDRIGSIQFEKIWREKDMFRYLTFASMCFRAGIPAGTIGLCRTAIESGLRGRLAEKLARKENISDSELPEAILKWLKKLEKDETLAGLIKRTEEEEVITEREIEDAFQTLKFKEQQSRKILDKFIHGNIVWMVNFATTRKDIGVIGAKDKLEEYKIIFGGEIDQLAIKVLEATYKIAGILYYENI
ncbi:MAG: hypothetical protein KAV98_04640 [Dehalococcoidia bacterium]|nr:hypothetical protein [Dehalococcoidia bacterium]